MKALLFGGTGMVGQGVLRECLADARVDHVTAVVRGPLMRRHPKLAELVVPDLFAIETVTDRLSGFEACFFCIGVTAAGRSEAEYTRLTLDLTTTIAALLARLNPSMTFIYVSGAGTDARGTGRLMWARVKGRTENALRDLPFKAAFMLRPGIIQPLHGIRSRTGWYRALYTATAPVTPLLRRLFPNGVTTTELVGRAMIGIADRGYPTPILETADINAVGGT